MRRRIIVGFLMIFCAFLTACSSMHSTSGPKVSELTLSGLNIKKGGVFPMFNSVSLTGPFDVTFHLGNDPSYPNLTRVVLNGDSNLIHATTYFVSKQTLTMYVNPQYTYNPYYRIHVDIYMPDISRLYFRGPGKITITDLNNSHLRVIGKGDANIYLAGYAQRLDATLTGTSRMNAKCLYTRTIFVNTVDKAQAEVLNNRGGISGLAADKSNIYYYSSPDMVAPYERQSGSIMRMQGIMPPYISAPEPTTVPEEKIVEGRG